MSYHATLFFSEPLVRQAAQAFWRRTVGIGFPFALAVMAAWLAALLWQGVTTWLVGALAMVLGFSVVILVLIYVVHYRNGLRKFREMGPPRASFQAEDATFTITSGLGSATLSWSSVREVWRFDQFWLLLFSKGQFSTLPLACVPAEMQTFIQQRVQATGGKIVG